MTEKEKLRDKIEDFLSMTKEEQEQDLLDSMSDAVRGFCEHLAFMKRIFVVNHGGTEEAYDRALNRELDKAYNRFKDMNSGQLALYSLMHMAMNGSALCVEMEDEDA